MILSPKEVFIVSRNIVRVLQDSTRLDDIVEVGNLVSRTRMRKAGERLRETDDGRRLLDERPEINSTAVDFDALRALPVGTLGRDYIDHMDAFGLSADKLNVPRPAPDDPDHVYLMRRFRGNHDLWHALLGLGIEGHEEVLVHAFAYGQLRLPVSALVVLFGGIKHLVLERRWATIRRQLYAAYALGRRAAPLLGVVWEDLWDTPTAGIRERYGLPSLAHHA